MRVVIVSENMSLRMGGEASLGLLYFRLFDRRGVDVHAVTHARVRDELRELLEPSAFARVQFIEDTAVQGAIWRLGETTAPRIRELHFGQAMQLTTTWQARSHVRTLVAGVSPAVVLEPSPIAPTGLSVMGDLGAPLVIGPMCGGLEFPPGFRHLDSTVARWAVRAGRAVVPLAHRLFPSKRRAAALIVANERTRNALPKGCRGQIHEVPESGVDLDVWTPRQGQVPGPAPVRFVFTGRLVDDKGVGYLLDAFARLDHLDVELHLVGDGPLAGELEAAIGRLALGDRVRSHGWQTREASAEIVRSCDVFVMPSLRECGGTSILEALASGLPCIVTNWLGPALYVDETCGIRVDPTNEAAFVHGLAAAMEQMASDPELRAQLGRAGIARMHDGLYGWEPKADRVLEICRSVAA